MKFWSLVVITAALITGGAILYPLTQAEATSYTNEDAQEILTKAGAVNVTVIWTSEHNVNCGAERSDLGLGGCFREESEDMIYISPELAGDDLEYVLLHEYAHVLQFRRGADMNECAADKMAIAWGASSDIASYDCN